MKRTVFSAALSLLLLVCPHVVGAQQLIAETGLEGGQMEVVIVEGILDVDGLIVLIATLFAVALVWYSGKANAEARLARRILSFGVMILGLNIALGALWDPIGLGNPFIDDVEDLLSVLGMSLVALSAWITAHDEA